MMTRAARSGLACCWQYVATRDFDFSFSRSQNSTRLLVLRIDDDESPRYAVVHDE